VKKVYEGDADDENLLTSESFESDFDIAEYILKLELHRQLFWSDPRPYIMRQILQKAFKA